MWSLLESDRVDLIGSDAHGVQRRRCHLQRAAELVATRIGVDAAAELTERRPGDVLDRQAATKPGMSLSHLTAIVVNWRTPDYTVRAVQALVSDGVPVERIVVLDNGSGDGSVERFRAELPGALVVALSENTGFSRANNEGARRLPGDHYLLVNSDAFVHRPGSVQALLDRLSDESVGIVAGAAPEVDRTLQSSVAPLPSPAVAAVQASGLSRFLPDRWQPSWSAHWSHTEEREVEPAIAAVLPSAARPGTSLAASTRARSCTRTTATSAGVRGSPVGVCGSPRGRSSCTSGAAR